MKSDRLLAMLLLLQTHGQLSATRLAEKLEVSVRTVYRDAEALSAAGVPVYAERGRAGGIAILPDFRTDVTGLTADEARALFVLINEQAHDDLGLADSLKSGLRKLMAGLPQAQQDLAARSTERLIVDPTRWGLDHSTSWPYLQTVQEAVLGDYRLRLAYEQRDSEDVLRLAAVDPHGLVHRGGNWYLVTTVDGADRQFRVDRIREAQILPDPVQRPKGYRLSAAWERMDQSWRADYSTVEVTVRVRRDALGLFQRTMGSQILNPVDRFADTPREWTSMTVRMRSFGHAQTLLGYGDRVVVTGPPAVLGHLADITQRLHDLYAHPHQAVAQEIAGEIAGEVADDEGD